MAIVTRATAVSAFSAAGFLVGAAIIPAGSAFASVECGAGATLVSDGICEVTFTETPDSAWTPPAGIAKLQALLVGGGGMAGEDEGDAYAGGGGNVILAELATTGEITITVAEGGNITDPDGSASVIAQGDLEEISEGGLQGASGGNERGGASGSGYTGDQYDLGGAGAGGNASQDNGGIGVYVNEIEPDVFTLFADNSDCYGGGGAGANAYQSDLTATLYIAVPGCGGGYVDAPEGASLSGQTLVWTGVKEDAFIVEAEANSGGGGGALDYGSREFGDGADGIVVLRYDAQLAETGFDSTGSLVAGAALVVAGVVAVTRRRRA
jgi:LPXTG-motif cell wall-anchored protein